MHVKSTGGEQIICSSSVQKLILRLMLQSCNWQEPELGVRGKSKRIFVRKRWLWWPLLLFETGRQYPRFSNNTWFCMFCCCFVIYRQIRFKLCTSKEKLKVPVTQQDWRHDTQLHMQKGSLLSPHFALKSDAGLSRKSRKRWHKREERAEKWSNTVLIIQCKRWKSGKLT